MSLDVYGLEISVNYGCDPYGVCPTDGASHGCNPYCDAVRQL